MNARALARFLFRQTPVYDRIILGTMRPETWIGHVQTGPWNPVPFRQDAKALRRLFRRCRQMMRRGTWNI